MITYTEYKKTAYKNTPQVFFDFVLRQVSYPLSFILLKFNVTPNQIGILSLCLSLVAGGVIVIGHPVIGFSVFLLSYLFDFCDGNVARVLMAGKGIPEVRRRKGLLLESLNTNISLLVLYVSLGVYFSILYTNFFLVYAFIVFGIKIISRYTVTQGYSVFREVHEKSNMYGTVNERFSDSTANKIKFFFTKTFFSLNFYLPIYLFTFVVIPESGPIVFLVYAGGDMLVSLVRLLRVFFRNYQP